MPTSFTVTLGLPVPGLRQKGYHTIWDANQAMISGGMLGRLSVKVSDPSQPLGLPSTSLNIDIAAGEFVASDSTQVDYAGVAGHAVPDGAVTYLWLDDSGVLGEGIAWPAATNVVRLAIVTAAGGVITALQDMRTPWRSAGGSAGTSPYIQKTGDTISDGAVFVLAGTTGTQIGSASSEKLGFWGAAPVDRPGSTEEIKAALASIGLLTDGGATPLNLDGGALTAGAFAFSADGVLDDGVDIQVGTSAGTMIGTGPTQRLGFFGAAPIGQPAGTSELVASLVALGFLASGGTKSLDLGAGAIACGPVTASGRVSAGRSAGAVVTMSGTSNVLAGTESSVRMDATGGNVNVGLGTPSIGDEVEFIRVDSSGNACIVQVAGSDLIYGPGAADVASTYSFTAKNKYARLRYIASNAWQVVGSN